MIAKIESVWGAGRALLNFCWLNPNPTPNKPPLLNAT